MVIAFLNSGRGNIIALKGPVGVFNEFYFDAHPKAVGVSKEALREVGIEIPSSGIIDPLEWPEDKKSKLKEKILALRDRIGLPLYEVEKLEKEKFRSLGDKKKVKINDELTVYANCHIFDLRVKDKKSKVLVIRTYQNSPVILDEVEVLSVGPETIEKWREIIMGAKGVIVVGDTISFEAALLNSTTGQEKVFIRTENTEVIKKLSNPNIFQLKVMPADADLNTLKDLQGNL
ncbi:MAG: hypothetical protein KKD11_05850 [Candidatus Omnitrophica bacterium]|nr:hypothetical protein [Candidatus Omnitrophota bacterium]